MKLKLEEVKKQYRFVNINWNEMVFHITMESAQYFSVKLLLPFVYYFGLSPGYSRIFHWSYIQHMFTYFYFVDNNIMW